ncbi:EamA family transporter [Clostridium sp. AUH-JLR23]|uniref:EamA family transporter n=1 Tax=Clostridium sp. AUH-JLR23 TaxID=1505062 RepID=UPI00356690FE
MKMLILCLVNTLMMVCGQILFKIGSNGKEITSLIDMIRLMFSPIVLIALCLYAGTTMLWLYILSKVDISFAYPIQALAFPVVMIVSAFIFHEQIPMLRWVGVIIIFIGVLLVVQK